MYVTFFYSSYMSLAFFSNFRISTFNSWSVGWSIKLSIVNSHSTWSGDCYIGVYYIRIPALSPSPRGWGRWGQWGQWGKWNGWLNL